MWLVPNRPARRRRARATVEWPKDEAELREAIEQCNARMEVRGRQLRYSYHAEPQPYGDLYRSQVLLSDQQTGAYRHLQIHVTSNGGVAVGIQGGPTLGTFAVGQTSISAWNELLTRLYEFLSR